MLPTTATTMDDGMVARDFMKPSPGISSSTCHMSSLSKVLTTLKFCLVIAMEVISVTQNGE